MLQNQRTLPVLCAQILLLFLCGFGQRNEKLFYDKPLGFYLNSNLNNYGHGVKISKVAISTLQPTDIATDTHGIAALKKAYGGQIVKWDLSVANEFHDGRSSDVIGTCNVWLEVLPKDMATFVIPVLVRSHSVKACDFWEGLRKSTTITVVGELDFETMAKDNGYTEDQLHIRPMVVKHENSYYVDGNLPRSITDSLLATLRQISPSAAGGR